MASTADPLALVASNGSKSARDPRSRPISPEHSAATVVADQIFRKRLSPLFCLRRVKGQETQQIEVEIFIAMIVSHLLLFYFGSGRHVRVTSYVDKYK